MIVFFKKIGKGIGYIFFVPIFLAVLAIFAILGFFLIIYLCIKGFFLFFTGRSLNDELPEDKLAKQIIEKSKARIEPISIDKSNLESTNTQSSYDYYRNEIEEATFNHVPTNEKFHNDSEIKLESNVRDTNNDIYDDNFHNEQDAKEYNLEKVEDE